MGTYIFFTVVWNGVQITCGSEYRYDLRSVAFRLFNRYFVSHPYFVVFKWWPMTEWNKFYFFSLVNFGSS